MIFVPDEAPTEVVEAMLARVPVTYGEVTLYAPVEPGANGSRGQHRITWEDPTTGRRVHRGRTSLAEAWRLTVETAESLYRQTHGTEPPRPRITLGGLLRRYLDPRLHPHWSEARRKTVTTLLTNWVVHDRVTVLIDGATHRAGDVPLEALTPSLCEQLLTHAHREKAYRTYVDVHRELGTMLRWASREGLRPKDDDLPDRIGLAKPSEPSKNGRPGAGVRPVDPDQIPPTSAVDELRAAALELHGQEGANAIDGMAYGGLRIGELLALDGDPGTMPFDTDDGVYRPYVWRRMHASRNELCEPKHGRRRHAWFPPWMTDQFATAIEASGGGPLIPAPQGGWFPVQRFRSRRFNVWMEAAGWPLQPDSDTTNKKWKWTAHSLRHFAASWMLNDLGLAPDDVAEFLGHGSGHQIWVMYSRVRPGLIRRATNLAKEAGDPRQR